MMKQEKAEKPDIWESSTSRAKGRLEEAKRTEQEIKSRLTTIKIPGGYIQTLYPRKWRQYENRINQ